MRRGGAWLVVGSLVGVALSPAAGRYRRQAAAGLARRRRAREDPVSAFCEAPCYAHDRARRDRRAATQATREP